jgi:hypothetical protein
MLTAGGRAPPFGDLAKCATAAGADGGAGVQSANLFARRGWALDYSHSGIKPLVPPDRCWQFVRDLGGVGMCGVDQDVAIQPRRDRRHNQDRRSHLFGPSQPKAFADGLALAVPSGVAGRVENFVADAIGDGDADTMLIRRQHRTGVNQLFEHRGRIIFGRVDNRRRGRVPPPRIESRALAIIDRVRALGIANPKTGQDAIRLLRAHTPPL